MIIQYRLVNENAFDIINSHMNVEEYFQLLLSPAIAIGGYEISDDHVFVWHIIPGMQ